MVTKAQTEKWLGAILFPFKVLTVCASVWLLVWHSRLPSDYSHRAPIVKLTPSYLQHEARTDTVYLLAWGDFTSVALSICQFYYLAGLLQVIGGFIQLLKSSRSSALWSISFGAAALIAAFFLDQYLLSAPGAIRKEDVYKVITLLNLILSANLV